MLRVFVFNTCCTSPVVPFQTLPEEEPSSFIAECYCTLPLHLGPQLHDHPLAFSLILLTLQQVLEPSLSACTATFA